MLDGILGALSDGGRWRNLPDRFGPWKTVYDRFRKWSQNGLWDKILRHLQARMMRSGDIDFSLFCIDGTLVRAHQDETIRTRTYSGKPLRALKNPYILEHETNPERMKPFPEQLVVSTQRNVMAYWDAEADPARTCFPAGQGVGAFHEIRPAAEVLREIVAGAERVLAGLAS